MEVALGLIAGFFLGVVADIVRQWLDRKTRYQERSERAAEDLIGLLDEARVPFKNAYRRDADVNDEAVRARVAPLRQKALLLATDGARQRVELIADVLEYYSDAQELTGETPSRIAWVAWEDGREALRKIIAGQPAGPPSQELQSYKASIDEVHEMWEQNMKKEAERRRQSSSGS